MIKELDNPLTDSYINFKRWCLSKEITWSWQEQHIPNYTPEDDRENFGFYYHTILEREEIRPKVHGHPDEHNLRKSIKVFSEIVNHNNITYSKIHRICVNATHPVPGNKLGIDHLDHDYPHKNMLVYLTDTYGGETMCEGDSYHGKENNVIVFEGSHCLRTPSRPRRVVIVYTFTQTN